MNQPSTSIRVAQALGITVASATSGLMLGFSFFTVPRILESPAPLLLKQWNALYDTGKKAGPVLATAAATAYFYLASSYRDDRAKLLGYLTAGALSVGIVPYTLAFMMATNKKLKEKVHGTKLLGNDDMEIEVGEETAHMLVDKWGMLNLGRGLMVAVAGVLGAWTTLN